VSEEELWNDFDLCKRLLQDKPAETLFNPNVCSHCTLEVDFDETADYENRVVVCPKCATIQTGSLQTPLHALHTYGKTRYNPMERFEYWIDLAEGRGKIPKKLKHKLDTLCTLSELKAFMEKKENRVYRKFYATILREWDDLFITPLSSTEKESLRLNFAHINRNHDRSVQQTTKRKKSLPHYTYLISFLLKKIQRDDLAEHFFSMRCTAISKRYMNKLAELF
jgi:hypothetical protein